MGIGFEGRTDRSYGLQLLQAAVGNERAEFREGQWDAIEALVRDRSRVVLLQRTGWGKSYVYFIATRMLRDSGSGPTLLISPLLALMRDQLAAASRIGLEAETINSQNRDEWGAIQERIVADEIDILLISPERLANEEFRSRVLNAIASRIGLLVIDEAHCISDWGHDFRPDYRRIGRLLRSMPTQMPVLAATATANERVLADVQSQIGDNCRVYRGSLERDSLQLQVVRLPDSAARLAWLAQTLPSIPGSGVIYTLTVRDAETVAQWLQLMGTPVYAYHGGLEAEERQDLEERLKRNEVKGLAATVALGMGFDKPDLGFVIHYQSPQSVIHYYQQIGRAGRSLDSAYAVLLVGEEDQKIIDSFIRQAFPPRDVVERVLEGVRGAATGLRLADLEPRVNARRMVIDKALKLLETEDPPAAVREDGLWYAAPVATGLDWERVERLTRLREKERGQVLAYASTDGCLMRFLRDALDDPHSDDCGKCANCAGHDLVTADVPPGSVEAAREFLAGRSMVIEPRKQKPSDVLADLSEGRTIPGDLRLDPGRCLARWDEPPWGQAVRDGKQVYGRFDEALVVRSAELIEQEWAPSPFPTLIMAVPS
ncbi:MAG: RecQ family ATP-dependent DNA helicase, partial [Spirochaetes bacterium]|nr:RecQ family ATP-dependent DNA helicase [Spirochaetota bacterium]